MRHCVGPQKQYLWFLCGPVRTVSRTVVAMSNLLAPLLWFLRPLAVRELQTVCHAASFIDSKYFSRVTWHTMVHEWVSSTMAAPMPLTGVRIRHSKCRHKRSSECISPRVFHVPTDCESAHCLLLASGPG